MPLSNQEKVVRHRARVNANDAARANYLAQRRASYQGRKREGKISNIRVAELSKQQQKKMKEKWREYQRNYRAKKRNEKMLADVLDLTPPSDMSAADEPIHNHLVDHEYEQPVLERPQSSSTPARKGQERKTKYNSSVLEDRERLRSEFRKAKRELKAANQKTQNLQRKLERRKKRKEKKTVSEKNSQKTKKKSSRLRREEVASFLCRDESSRMLSGKKDTVTKNKVKQQRRVLLYSMKDLHAEYNASVMRHLKLSYRQFVRYCPFYVTPAKDSDRNTCACIDHENVKLLVEKLLQKGILLTNSISELLAVISCDTTNKDCMYRTCAKCCYNEIEFEGPLEETVVTWEQWSRVVTSEEGKTYANFAKVKQSGKCEDLLALLNKKLDSLAKHQFNWLHQAKTLRELKETLHEDEICLHIDFSENYGCKLNSEIQAFHFGGSRKQVTIHTCVAYTASSSFSYASLSPSLRHDERAVWAHLEPVLKDVVEKCSTPPSTLHIISDGPVTQYRNRKNLYLLSTVPFMCGFQRVTWNFSEKSHGKGAPDGVGGAVKRIADTAVQRGTDLQTAEDLYNFLKDQPSSVEYYWISEEAIAKYDESVPTSVPAVKGTLKMHQVTSEEPATIQWRDISCFCARPGICKCYSPSALDFHNLRKNLPSTSTNCQQDLKGRFILVRYDSMPFVGQVTQVVGQELEVSCMKQMGRKNVFTWPQPPDLLFYFESDVLHIISEPEPLNSRHSKLTMEDWNQFQAHKA